MGFSVATSDVGMLSGDYLSATVRLADPRTPETLVENKFSDALGKAEEILELLIGADGTGGYLGEMNSVLDDAPGISIAAPIIDTSLTLETTGVSMPVFDSSGLSDYPDEIYAAPTLAALPSIDDDFSTIEAPGDINPAMSWTEEGDDLSVYTPLLAKMLTFLADGSTGIDPSAEAAMYERARVRQQTDRLAEYNRINDTALEMQFQYPSGAMLSALTSFSIGANRQDADIENNIIVTQAENERLNNQAMVQAAIGFETIIRQAKGDKSARKLTYEKEKVAAMLQNLGEQVRKYVAELEGRKAKVTAQVETLKGVIEGNNGLIDIFRAQYDALKTRVDAVSSQNKGVIDAFLGEVQGFGEIERAVASRNDSSVKLIAAKVSAAELEVRAAIAEAQNIIAGYTAEGQLKATFSTDMARIAAQCFASLTSSTNVSASLGYSGSDARHSGFNVSVSASETHSIEHDPAS